MDAVPLSASTALSIVELSLLYFIFNISFLFLCFYIIGLLFFCKFYLVFWQNILLLTIPQTFFFKNYVDILGLKCLH